MRDVGTGTLGQPRDQHAGLVEPGAHEVARAIAHEIVVVEAPRGNRDSRRARQRPADGSDLLAAGVREHGVRLGRGVELEDADWTEPRDKVAPHILAHATAGEQPHRVVLLAEHGLRVDEPTAHLARVVDDADAVAAYLVPERLRLELARERQARATDERAAGRDERARRMVQRQAAVD
nr:hypothetical protein [Myxococcota bacterium]